MKIDTLQEKSVMITVIHVLSVMITVIHVLSVMITVIHVLSVMITVIHNRNGGLQRENGEYKISLRETKKRLRMIETRHVEDLNRSKAAENSECVPLHKKVIKHTREASCTIMMIEWKRYKPEGSTCTVEPYS